MCFTFLDIRIFATAFIDIASFPKTVSLIYAFNSSVWEFSLALQGLTLDVVSLSNFRIWVGV